MADVKFSRADTLKELAEGRVNNSVQLPTIAPPAFVRMIVLDVISDPNTDLQKSEKLDRWIDEFKVRNIGYAPVLPRNTIIAKRVGEVSPPMFVFPFFPSHLSLPCKPGECVWVMFEKPSEAANSDIAFWMCRVAEPHLSDDVNHSHPGRSFEISLYPDAKDVAAASKDSKSSTSDDVWHELRNSPVKKDGDDRYSSSTGVILKGEPEDIFEKLITESSSSVLMSYEVVPRFRKRPGDVVLEGTNNSLIVLGTDRSGSVSTTPFVSSAGSIDLVVGRGQTIETFGKSASTTSIQDAEGKKKGTELKKELDKSMASLSVLEGDPDFINDRSRILIAQKTSVDTNFKLDDYNKKLEVSDAEKGDAAIVVKSDKIRLIARSDIEILVKGFKDSATSPDGQKRKDEETDVEKWASITISSKGEIIIKPSKEGVIKLGGEDASKAILCTESISAAGGNVSATPISTTMGGQVGVAGSAGLGVWASKILVK
jgi:hypothetical protein